MINITNSSLEHSSADLLIIPHSTAGTISESFDTLLKKSGIKYMVPTSDLGDFSILKISSNGKWKYLGLACSVNDFTSTYAGIYQIIRNLSASLPADVKSIAMPLLGAGSGNLNPDDVFCLLYKAINELLPPEIQVNLHVLRAKLLNNIEELKGKIEGKSSKKLVFEYTIQDIDRISWVSDQMHMKEFYFERARKKFTEFLNDENDSAFYRTLLQSFQDSKTVFSKFLHYYNAESPEHKFLSLCGELVAYIDYNAYNKSLWNKYRDKRTLARSSVNQTRWIENLIAFKESGRNYEILTDSIKNALIYLDSPSENLTMLSSRHRSQVSKILFDSSDPNEISSEICRYFKIRNITCLNPDNEGSLYSRILYIPDIKNLWSPVTNAINIKLNPISSLQTAQTTTEQAAELEPEKETAETIRERNLQLLMHSDIYAKKDLLNYDTYASIIARLITTGLSSPPFNISIMAPWGKGKTSLMRFIENRINKSDVPADQNPAKARFGRMLLWSIKSRTLSFEALQNPCIWFNAWKFQKSEQVWAGLADEIILQLASKLSPIDRQKFWFRINLKRIDRGKIIWEIAINAIRKVFLPGLYLLIGALLSWIISSSANASILPFWLTQHPLAGITLPVLIGMATAAQKLKTEWKADSSLDLSKFISRPEYRSKTGYLQQVEADLKQAIAIATNPAKPAVIFIDDLDRCSPMVIAEVVEAINAFMSGELSNCYFIIGQDPRIVTASLDASYAKIAEKLGNLGSEHSSIGRFFLEKFSQLTINLPVMSETLKKNFIDSLLSALDESAVPAQEEQKELIEQYGQLQNEILNLNEPKEIFTDRKREIEDKIKLFKPELILTFQDAILSNAFKNYQLDDNEIENIIIDISEYLDSPRTIKRFLNLFLFYHFFRYTIPGSSLTEVEDQVLGKWLILMVRWPLLVQAVQWNTEKVFFTGSDCLERAEKFDNLISKSETYTNYCELLKNTLTGELTWLCDEALFEICKGSTEQDPVKLADIIKSGVW